MSIDVFKKRNQCKNFDEIEKFIIVNINLETRSFCSKCETQNKICDQLKLSQSTIFRHLSLMIQTGIIRPAFTGDNDPCDPKSGMVCDQNGILFNNIYYVNDAFTLLACEMASNKLIDAFRKRVKQQQKKMEHHYSIALLTCVIEYEKRQLKAVWMGISGTPIKKMIQGITSCSEAVNIIRKRVEKRDDLIDISASAQLIYINTILKRYGFNNANPSGGVSL